MQFCHGKEHETGGESRGKSPPLHGSSTFLVVLCIVSEALIELASALGLNGHRALISGTVPSAKDIIY